MRPPTDIQYIGQAQKGRVRFFRKKVTKGWIFKETEEFILVETIEDGIDSFIDGADPNRLPLTTDSSYKAYVSKNFQDGDVECEFFTSDHSFIPCNIWDIRFALDKKILWLFQISIDQELILDALEQYSEHAKEK